MSSQSSQSLLIITEIPDLGLKPFNTLINCSASMNFINSTLANMYPNLLVAFKQPLPLQYFDGSSSSSNITHYILVDTKFPDNTIQSIKFLITKTHPLTPVVLGLNWLQTWNPKINWTDGETEIDRGTE